MEPLEGSRGGQVLVVFFVTTTILLCSLSPPSLVLKDLNEAEILAILEAIRLFNVSFWQPLIMECDSLNAISWVSNVAKGRWKFYLALNEFGVGCGV